MDDLFSGFTAWRETKRRGIPRGYFHRWLKEKWKADLKTVAWAVIMSPFLLLWLTGIAIVMIGAIVSAFGSLIYETKKLLPAWAFLSKDLRARQIGVIDEIKIWLMSQGMTAMAASTIPLCEDEGCPNHGTPHVCVPASHCGQDAQKETPAEAGALSTIG